MDNFNLHPGTIIMLNGASSSGKTSILEELQSILPQPYLNAGIDKIIWMLPKRYLDRPLWDEVLGLGTRPGEVGITLFSGMHHAIAGLARSGNFVIADHVLVEPAWLWECSRLFADLYAFLIGIHCPLEVLEQREGARKDRTLGQARAQFPLVHRHRIYDFEVDTSKFSAWECARQISEFILSQPTPIAFPGLYETQKYRRMI